MATCLCQTNPNSPGCPGYNGHGIDAQNLTPPGGAPSGTSPDVNAAMPGGGFSDSIPVAGINGAGAGGASGSGAGAGGGAGGGGFPIGGGAGGGTAGKAGSADSKKALNTNILGGFDGGGGGGGGGGSSRTASADPNSAYKAYMPGGARDPSSLKALGAGQVTGSGSKSNWEKINERYADTKPTLLNH
jgi:hypothetical protein